MLALLPLDHVRSQWAQKVADELGAPAIVAPRNPGEFLVDIVKFREAQSGGRAAPEVAEAWQTEVSTAAASPWREAQHPEVAAWLSAQAVPLDHLAAALAREHFYLPVLRESETATILSAQAAPAGELRGMANMLAARACLRLGSSDTLAAWQDSMLIVRLGILLGRQPSLYERLAALSILEKGLTLQAAILRQGMTPADAHAARNGQKAFEPLVAIAEAVDLYERFMVLDQFVLLARFGPDVDASSPTPRPAHSFTFGLYPIHFDPPMRDANVWSDRLVRAVALPDFAEREFELEAISTEARIANADIEAAPSSGQKGLNMLAVLAVHDLRGARRAQESARQWYNLVNAGLEAAEKFPASATTQQSIAPWAKALPPTLFSDTPPNVRLETGILTLSCEGPEPLPASEVSIPGLNLKVPAPVRKHFEVQVKLPPP